MQLAAICFIAASLLPTAVPGRWVWLQTGARGKSNVRSCRLLVLLVFVAAACQRESPLLQLPVAKTKRQLGTVSLPRLVPGEDGVVLRADEPIDVLVRTAVLQRDFAPVAARVKTLLPQQKDDEAAYELSRIYYAFSMLGEEQNTDGAEASLDGWVASDPSSHVALTARGFFRVGRAWRARGGGWSKDVTDEGRQQFERFLSMAREDLEKARSLRPDDPNGSSGLIAVDIGDGAPRAQMERDYQLALDAAPGHYGARIGKLHYLKPKWYGTEEEMLAFAFSCTREAKRHPYAALIEPDALLEEHEFPATMLRRKSILSAFSGGPPRPPAGYLSYVEPWRRVSDAYEVFLAAHPDNLRVRLGYAHAAYHGAQWDVFIEQAEAIGDHWVATDDWRSEEAYRKVAASAYRLYAASQHVPAGDYIYFTRRAVAFAPGDAKVRYAHAVSLHRVGRLEAAEVQYRRAIGLDAKYPRPYAGLIALMHRMQRCDEVMRLRDAAQNLHFEEEDTDLVARAVRFCSR
jgi:hypothetical protein